ncbi:MAG: TetR/AcrR family transcriptional regulator [Dehalococcoidia bacterium]
MPPSKLIAPSPSRVQRRRERNRDALVGAARTLFARDGFESTTIAGIAEAADLGFGTFYLYFRDKAEILRAVLDEGKREVDEVLLEADDPGVPAGQALARFSERFVRTVSPHRDVMALMWLMAIKHLAPPIEPDLPRMLGGAIRPIVERGVAEGAFLPVNADLTSRLIASMHMSVLMGPSSDDVDAIIDAICELELRALGAPATTTATIEEQEKTR